MLSSLRSLIAKCAIIPVFVTNDTRPQNSCAVELEAKFSVNLYLVEECLQHSAGTIVLSDNKTGCKSAMQVPILYPHYGVMHPSGKWILANGEIGVSEYHLGFNSLNIYAI